MGWSYIYSQALALPTTTNYEPVRTNSEPGFRPDMSSLQLMVRDLYYLEFSFFSSLCILSLYTLTVLPFICATERQNLVRRIEHLLALKINGQCLGIQKWRSKMNRSEVKPHILLHEPDRAELQLSWCQGTQPVGHKAPNYLVYISRLSPALQSLYLSLFTRFSPSIFQQILLHVYLGRESQHSLMSCMRMKTCMKMVAVWGYASGQGWCVSCQSICVRIWEIIHIRALGSRDREVNQQVKEASKLTSSRGSCMSDGRCFVSSKKQIISYIGDVCWMGQLSY